MQRRGRFGGYGTFSVGWGGGCPEFDCGRANGRRPGIEWRGKAQTGRFPQHPLYLAGGCRIGRDPNGVAAVGRCFEDELAKGNHLSRTCPQRVDDAAAENNATGLMLAGQLVGLPQSGQWCLSEPEAERLGDAFRLSNWAVNRRIRGENKIKHGQSLGDSGGGTIAARPGCIYWQGFACLPGLSPSLFRTLPPSP